MTARQQQRSVNEEGCNGRSERVRSDTCESRIPFVCNLVSFAYLVFLDNRFAEISIQKKAQPIQRNISTTSGMTNPLDEQHL